MGALDLQRIVEGSEVDMRGIYCGEKRRARRIVKMAGDVDKMVELFTNMNRQLGEMTAEIRSVLARLEKGDQKMEDHEVRIDALEKKTHTASAVEENKRNDLLFVVVETVIKWGGWAILLIIGLAAKITGVSSPVAN